MVEVGDIEDVIGMLDDKLALIQLKGITGRLAKVAVILSDCDYERYMKLNGPKKDGFLVMKSGAGVRKHVKS